MQVGGSEHSLDQSQVIQEISPNDGMIRWPPFGGGLEQYFALGEEAVKVIRGAMDVVGNGEPRSILDLPCGHGRVMRMLKAAFPKARLTACDIDHEAVNFCVETFGASPVYTSVESRDIPVHGKFDLIWCGSLLTHFPADWFAGFLEQFESHLAPSGLVVFTTSGRAAFEILRCLLPDQRPAEVSPARIDTAKQYFPIPEEALPDFANSYETEGFAYNPIIENFGTSLSSPAWVCRQLERLPGLRLVSYLEQGWGSTQDVVACQRRSARAE